MSAAGRRTAIRLAALVILLALYGRIDWGPLRHSVCAATAAGLHALGSQPATDGGALLFVEGGPAIRITPGCTYARLFLVSAPFFWRRGASLARNAQLLAAVFVALSIVNVGRLTLALHLLAGGVPWSLAHDALDTAIHTAVLLAAILPALRDDWRDAPAPRAVASLPHSLQLMLYGKPEEGD